MFLNIGYVWQKCNQWNRRPARSPETPIGHIFVKGLQELWRISDLPSSAECRQRDELAGPRNESQALPSGRRTDRKLPKLLERPRRPSKTANRAGLRWIHRLLRQLRPKQDPFPPVLAPSSGRPRSQVPSSALPRGTRPASHQGTPFRGRAFLHMQKAEAVSRETSGTPAKARPLAERPRSHRKARTSSRPPQLHQKSPSLCQIAPACTHALTRIALGHLQTTTETNPNQDHPFW